MKIKKLTLSTADLDATKEFYSKVLGLGIIEQSGETISFAAGSSVLKFVKTTTGYPVYHFAFNIPHNKIEEALRWATARLEIIPETQNNIIADFNTWNAKAVYFYDNNRNIVELIARFDLPNAEDKPFTGVSILSISEAGIPVLDVRVTCENLVNCYSMNYFLKQPPMADFAALGDDEGLFIVVNINRNWYPTNHLSEKWPIKVKVEINEEVFEIPYHNR